MAGWHSFDHLLLESVAVCVVYHMLRNHGELVILNCSSRSLMLYNHDYKCEASILLLFQGLMLLLFYVIMDRQVS